MIGIFKKDSLRLLAEANITTYIIVKYNDSIYGWLEIFNYQNETIFNTEMDKINAFLKEFNIDGIILEVQYLYVNTTINIFYNIIVFIIIYRAFFFFYIVLRCQ